MRGTTLRGFVLGVTLVAISGFQFWGGEARGNRAYRKGEYLRAVERYRTIMSRRGATPRLDYNLGTALLRLGESQEARELLAAALREQSPELRARAFFNLGNALARGTPGQMTSADDLRAGVEAYRRSLLLEPNREDTRWNLELAMRRLEDLERNPPPLSGSGDQQDAPPRDGIGEDDREQQGGEDATFPQPGESERQQSIAPDMAEPPFPLELAEQILRAVEERERSLQREKLKRQRTRGRGPDW